MNDRYKFRSWDQDTKTMVYFDFIDVQKNLFSIRNLVSKNKWSNPVMQFTGILDTTGKEIYEGDYIKADGIWQDGEIAEVIYTQKYNGFGVRSPSSTDPMLPNCIKNIKVVGNIYESTIL